MMINFYKKLFIVSILFLAFFGIRNEVNAAGCTGTGNCYWVGGTGNANDTAHWATASGGATTGGLPGATDNCNFDTSSSTANAAYTFTINAATTCKDFIMAGPGAGNDVTWAGTSTLAISGSMNLSGGSTDIIRTYTGDTTFNSTSTGKTITTNGVVVGGGGGDTAFDGSGGEWTIQDAFNMSTGTLTLVNGTLDTNGQTITCGPFVSLTGTRTLTLGASTFNVTGWNVNSALTFNANTSTINASSSPTTFIGGGKTYNTVVITATGTSSSITGANSFANLTINGAAAITPEISIDNTQTITTAFVLAGNSVTNRILIKSSIVGTARTISSASNTISNADFQDITGAGAGSWNLSAISGGSGDCGGNSSITFTTATTRYWVGNTGSWNATSEWSASSGGASGATVPLCHDNVVFNNGSFNGTSQTVTANMARLGKDISWTGYSEGQTPTWTTTTTASIFGSLTLISGMTLSASAQTYTFKGRGTHTITMAGKAWAKPINFDGFGGSYALQDTFTTSLSMTLNSGTLNANNQNLSLGAFSTNNSTNTRTLTMGSGTWEIVMGTVNNNAWAAASTGLTFNVNTSTIKLTGTSTTAFGNNFTGGNLTYNNVWFSRGGSTASITISGNNTFNDFKDDGTAAHSLLFTTNSTQTVTTFTVSGTVGNVITINSTTTGIHTLVKSGGGTISSDYLNIQHSVATPACTWFAGVNSTNNQAVATAGSGWTFTAPAACGSRRIINI